MGITSTMGFRTNFNRTMGERRKVIAHAATATLTVGESGSMITNEGATATVVLTLPAVASSTGCYYWFVNAENFDLTIAAPANLMVTFNDDTATSVTFGASNEKRGGGVFAYCDGAKWMVQLMTYDAADQAVTVA